MTVESNLTNAQVYATQRNPFNYAKIEQINRDIATSWLTLDEITDQINNWDDESQDNYLTGLELAVRMAIEDYLGCSIFPVTYRVYYPYMFAGANAVYLDLPEVSMGYQGASPLTINSVQYYAGNSPVLTTVATTDYYYDNTGNRVVVKSLPQPLSQTIANPIVVTYTLNQNFIAQYPVVKQAGLLLFTHLYNNRANTTEAVLHEIPFGVAQLLRPYKPLVM